MNKKHLWSAIPAATLLMLTVGCSTANTAKKENTKESNDTEKVTGIYLTYGENNSNYIFADPEQNTLFLAEIPEDKLYDQEGNKISRSDLEAGSTLELYGKGAMTMSIPPQYSGVSKAVIVKDGDAALAEKYQALVDELYPEADPSEIPYLTIENTQSLGYVSTSVDPFSYRWTGGNSANDTSNQILDPSPDAVLPEIINDTEDKHLTLLFSSRPDTLSVKKLRSDLSSSEDIPVESNDQGFIITAADSSDDVIYEAEGTWEYGTVVYRFLVKGSAAN